MVAALQNSDRETGIDPDKIQKISEYWRDVRPVYAGFESELATSTAEIYISGAKCTPAMVWSADKVEGANSVLSKKN